MSFIFRLKLRLLQESENNTLLDLGTVEGGELCLAVTSKSYIFKEAVCTRQCSEIFSVGLKKKNASHVNFLCFCIYVKDLEMPDSPPPKGGVLNFNKLGCWLVCK